jgi:hypothetical protein
MKVTGHCVWVIAAVCLVAQWRSCLWHCATSRKVAGSIPYGITGIFRWNNPSYGAGVDSASNRNEYQEYFLGDKGGRCVGLTTLPSSCADCLDIWESQPAGTLRASQACTRIALPWRLVAISVHIHVNYRIWTFVFFWIMVYIATLSNSDYRTLNSRTITT